MTLLNELDAHEAAAKEHSLAGYHEIVRRLAAGDDDPELSEVRDALTAAGKTTENLKEDIREEQRLRHTRGLIEAGIAAEEEKQRITRQIAIAESTLKAAQAAHAAEVRPLQAQLINVDRDISIGRASAHELSRSQRDTSPSAILKTVRINIQSTAKRLAEATDRARRLNQELEGTGGPGQSPADAEALKALGKARSLKSRMELHLESLRNEEAYLLAKIRQG
jgi:hypothetical protein